MPVVEGERGDARVREVLLVAGQGHGVVGAQPVREHDDRVRARYGRAGQPCSAAGAVRA